MKKENYLMIEGNKIPISKETAESIKKSFKEEKGKTYEDVRDHIGNYNNWYISSQGLLYNQGANIDHIRDNYAIDREQLRSLLDLNKLVNVAKYLNDGWVPDWSSRIEEKHGFRIDHYKNGVTMSTTCGYQESGVYFKTEELTQQAKEILGEDTIKSALTLNY